MTTPIPPTFNIPFDKLPIAPSTLLMGTPGSGKTYTLATLAKLGIRVFVVAMDSTSVTGLVDGFNFHKAPLDLLHWSYHPPVQGGVSALQSLANLYSIQTYEGLSKIKDGINRTQTQELMKVYNTLLDFKCDRTGKSFGPCASFGPDCALALDSLSSLNKLIWQNFMGLKPAPAQGEWGIIMNHEEGLIENLCGSLRCFFILLAHQDRDKDEVTGASQVNPRALGSKLGPNIGQYFSECITQKNTPAGYMWSTNEANSTNFNRKLPKAATLLPDFRPIVESHYAALRQIEATRQQPQSAPVTPAATTGAINNG